MKKNLISIIILALCVINLVLNAIIIFVCMPSATKTNKLITEISSILNLELEKNEDENKKINLENLATYSIAEAKVVNLKNDGTGTSHYVQVGVTLTLDNSADDYEVVNEKLPSLEGSIDNDVRDVISSYTYAEITDAEIQASAKAEILAKLKDRFQTECIYSVDFSSFTTQ